MSTGVWNALPFNLCPMLLGLLYSSSKDGVQGDSYCLGKEARRRRETYDVYGSLECPSIQSVPYAPQTLYSSSKDGVQGKTKTVGRKDGSRKRKVFLFSQDDPHILWDFYLFCREQFMAEQEVFLCVFYVEFDGLFLHFSFMLLWIWKVLI